MSIKYTDDHEWGKQDGDTVVVGITDFAQEQLGEVVFVELPEVGQQISKGDEAAVVESVKAAGEVKSPVSGEVVKVNEALVDSPEMVNDSPQEEAWFFVVKPSDESELDSLMDDEAYKALLESLA